MGCTQRPLWGLCSNNIILLFSCDFEVFLVMVVFSNGLILKLVPFIVTMCAATEIAFDLTVLNRNKFVFPTNFIILWHFNPLLTFCQSVQLHGISHDQWVAFSRDKNMKLLRFKLLASSYWQPWRWWTDKSQIIMYFLD